MLNFSRVSSMGVLKFRSAEGASCQLALITTARPVVTCVSVFNLVNGILLVCSRWYGGHEMVCLSGTCLVGRM